MIKGLTLVENEDMEMLSSYARKGWILYKVGILGYTLKRSNPQQLQYFLDYRDNPDKEYFLCFNEAGWSYVCSLGNTIHIFSALKDTKPIYTDNDTELKKYIIQYEMAKKAAISSFLCTVLFLILLLFFKYGHIPDIYGKIFGTLLILSSTIIVFTVIPCISFYSKINRIKGDTENNNRNYKIIYGLLIIETLLLVFLFYLNKFNFLNIDNIVFYILCFIGVLLGIFTCIIKDV
ncbi:MAG: DUF2812 domain-containing protein [Clostridium luticellarii]|nr:DUF2812 domain-containing protein [Clostridium luticellarii]MCI1996777.1 DUF2812 domain-containing protein [Clostridium luticellarii]MCI2039628.1 DUF2812 domain-containing protein [Clostridium luticellarii]